MVRCDDFYVKVEKDGNFCGMEPKEYRRLMQYMEYCKTHNIEVGSITQSEWRALVAKRKELDNPAEPSVDESKPIEKDKVAIATENNEEEVLNSEPIEPKSEEIEQTEDTDDTEDIEEINDNKEIEGTPLARIIGTSYPEDIPNREMEIYLDIQVLLKALEFRMTQLESNDKKEKVMTEMVAIVKRVK